MSQLFQLEMVSILRYESYSNIYYICFEIYYSPLKGLWKVTLIMPLSPSQVSLPNYWGQRGKNHLLGTDKTITCNL